MSKRNVDLSIIIVNYNTASLTHACLASVFKAMTPNDRWEVILVDNGSTDDSKELLVSYIKKDSFRNSLTTLIESSSNVGFSAGNNLGIQKAVGEYILLLNSDTEVAPGAIQVILQRISSRSDVGAATCKLVLANGEIDPACHRGFPTPWAAVTYFVGLERIFPHTKIFGQYHMGYLPLEQEHEVDAISGAFFMIKRSVIEHVGPLDESFFMYGEDLDWAFRIRQQGLKILYIPHVSTLHRKKKSGRDNDNQNSKKKSNASFYQTMQLFYKKHYEKVYPKIITWIIMRILDLKISTAEKGS